MNRASVTHLMRTTALVLGALVCAGSLCSKAYAQSWLPDRNYTEGPGIRVGDLEIHPGIAIRTGWDSNVFRSDGSERRRVSSGLLAVTPHLNLSTLSRLRITEGEDAAAALNSLPKIAFSTGLAGTYFQYFKDVAQPNGVNIGVDFDSQLKIMPLRPVSLDLGMGYNRTVQPFTERAPTGNYAASYFLPTARLNFGSRSRVLTSYLGYAPLVTYYERDAVGFKDLNNANHAIQGGSAWKFLPHTALLFDAELNLQSYFADVESLTASDVAVLVSNGKRFVTRLGLNGAITQRLSLRAMVGYATMLLDRAPLSDYENAVGEAVLGYRFGVSNQFDIGYVGAITPSYIGGWMRVDRGFARAKFLFARVFMLSLEAGAGYATYGRAYRVGVTPGTVLPLGQDGDVHRKDVRIDGAVRAEYRLTNWLALMTDFTTFSNLTDFKYAATLPDGPPVPDPARFLDFQVYGGVRASY